jgi:hypothetical protein
MLKKCGLGDMDAGVVVQATHSPPPNEVLEKLKMEEITKYDAVARKVAGSRPNEMNECLQFI